MFWLGENGVDLDTGYSACKCWSSARANECTWAAPAARAGRTQRTDRECAETRENRSHAIAKQQRRAAHADLGVVGLVLCEWHTRKK